MKGAFEDNFFESKIKNDLQYLLDNHTPIDIYGKYDWNKVYQSFCYLSRDWLMFFSEYYNLNSFDISCKNLKKGEIDVKIEFYYRLKKHSYKINLKLGNNYKALNNLLKRVVNKMILN